MSEDIPTIKRLVEEIRPILAGIPPQIQSVVLAELLSIWLRGHRVDGGDADQNSFLREKLREDLLKGHIELVRQLTRAAE
jgi:hypothetical protein